VCHVPLPTSKASPGETGTIVSVSGSGASWSSRRLAATTAMNGPVTGMKICGVLRWRVSSSTTRARGAIVMSLTSSGSAASSSRISTAKSGKRLQTPRYSSAVVGVTTIRRSSPLANAAS
jgi:hypothetical protein